MKLHGGLNSPFVRMCMVTAIECNLAMRVQLRPTLANPQEINPELERIYPLGKVPVLETDHGHAIYDSRVIMEYFCHISGNKALLPDDGAKRFRILPLLALAQGLAEAGVELRYETFARPEASRWPALADRLRARIRAAMRELENSRNDLQEPTLASLGTCVALEYIDFRNLAPSWRGDFYQLAAWQTEFTKRESLRNTTPKA